MEPPGDLQHVLARSAAPLLLGASALLWAGCLDEATSPSDMRAQLAMAAVVRASDAAQASYVDAWHIEVSRPGSGVIADASGPMAPEEATVETRIEVKLESACETLVVAAELSSGGEVWFHSSGSHQICVGRRNLIEIEELAFVRPHPVVTPSELAFVIQEGDVDGGSFSIAYSGQDALAWAAGIQESGATWLSLPASSGLVTAGAPRSVELGVSADGLAPGAYSAHVVVTGEGFPGPIGSVSVSLTVTARPRIGLSTHTVTFSAPERATPEGQSLTVSNAGGGVLEWEASVDVPWLSIVPASGTLGTVDGVGSAQDVAVSLESEDLPPGDYTGTITFTAPGAFDTPQDVSVLLTVRERVPPTLGNPVYELRVLNDPTCFNDGSRYDVHFDYADTDGDVPVAEGSFVGEPLRFQWAFLPDGHTGESVIDTDVEGDGFSGTAHLDLCIAYEIAGNTSLRATFLLRDTWPLWSDPLSIVIPRPTGGHAPPGGG